MGERGVEPRCVKDRRHGVAAAGHVLGSQAGEDAQVYQCPVDIAVAGRGGAGQGAGDGDGHISWWTSGR